MNLRNKLETISRENVYVRHLRKALREVPIS